MTLAQAFTMGKNAIQNNLQSSFAGWTEFLNSDEGQQKMTELINLFSLLAQVGTGALSTLAQGALWASNNLDFILPVLAAISAALVILKVQAELTAQTSVAGALASARSWMLAHIPVLLLVMVLAAAMIAAQQFGIGMQEVGMWVGQVSYCFYFIPIPQLSCNR